MLSCDEIRSEFPALRGGLVFLDSAASTLKPARVVEAMSRFALERYANVHRGLYRLSLEATKAYEEAHSVVASLIGARSEEIVFTSGTTASIQLAAQLLAYNGILRSGDEIVTSVSEHHSNLLPWARIARQVGAKLRLIPVDRVGRPRWDLLDEYMSDRTKVVAAGHVSNVTGYESPIREIARTAHRHGAIVVVDGAQSVPHLPISVDELGADMLAFSGHKMLGPTGIGVLWIRGSLARSLEPPLGGGGTISRVRIRDGEVEIEWEEPPLRFEAGTPPIIEAVGLAEAVRMLMEIGMDRIAAHERELVAAALEGLSRIPQIEIVGPASPEERRGIVSFSAGSMDPDLVGAYLSRRGIAVRTGLHCAHPLHDAIGRSEGSVRASFYLYNCPSDVEALVSALRTLLAG